MQVTFRLAGAEHSVVMLATAGEAATWAEHARAELQDLAEAADPSPEHVADAVHTARMAMVRLTAFLALAETAEARQPPRDRGECDIVVMDRRRAGGQPVARDAGLQA